MPLPSTFWTHRVDPGSRWSKGGLGYSSALVLDSHLTNLGSGVIRPTQSLASSPVTDRITLNHLHSTGVWGGGVITYRAGCNHKPCVDMGNALRVESGQSAVDGSLFLLLIWGNCVIRGAVVFSVPGFGKCLNYHCKCRDHSRCRQHKHNTVLLRPKSKTAN